MRFLSPDSASIIGRLPLRNPAELRKLYTLTIDEIIDYLAALGQALDLSHNAHMQAALEHSYAATDLTSPILRRQYSLIQQYFSQEMLRGFIDVPIAYPMLKAGKRSRCRMEGSPRSGRWAHAVCISPPATAR